jgi:NAD(P)-dependent dehydrogenase (short-subunit alcohol dehydrogenase family)
MNSLSGKKILVVGASSGIGYAVLEQLRSRGAEVYAWSRSEPEGGFPDGITYSQVDVTQDVSEQNPQFPNDLDGVVFAPGTISLGAFKQLKPQVYLDDYDLNVVGAVRVIQAVQGALVAGSGASVVMYSTVAAGVGMQFHASIASAKAALHGLTKTLSAEFAEKNVRFNLVAPSLTDTPLAGRLLSNEKKRDAAAQRHPLKRVGTPQDIARATLFFLDPENSWITGQVIGVDGGLSAISGL